jgi:hypothetical protein
MEDYRHNYIDILNSFKSGNKQLSKREVFTYLAAIKLNMILYRNKDKLNDIDLIDLDKTKIAKVTLRNNMSRAIMPIFVNSSSTYRFILVCETNTRVDDKFVNCEIVRLDYDKELSNVPVNQCLTCDLDKLKLNRGSQVLYQPKTDTFTENRKIQNIKNISSIGGILTIRNYGSTVILVPDEYYIEVMTAIRYHFGRFKVTQKKHFTKIKGCEIYEWRELLESLRNNLV